MFHLLTLPTNIIATIVTQIILNIVVIVSDSAFQVKAETSINLTSFHVTYIYLIFNYYSDLHSKHEVGGNKQFSFHFSPFHKFFLLP